jgi:hypothetical protein
MFSCFGVWWKLNFVWLVNSTTTRIRGGYTLSCGWMYLIRLLVVGDIGVGKEELLIRFHEDQNAGQSLTDLIISILVRC